MTIQDIHYNTSLPPVDLWLQLKLRNGEVIKAKRTSYINNKTDAWPVILEDDSTRCVDVTGWAYC
jgi:hypothetical protein